MRNIRTVLSLPFVGLFYLSMSAAARFAWVANLVAGEGGIVTFIATDGDTGEETHNVGQR